MTTVVATAADLLTDEFIEQMLKDVQAALPSNMDGFTRAAAKRRLIREALLKRLGG